MFDIPGSVLPLALGLPGTSELILILVIILVIFGGANLPRLFGSVGKSIREFKKAVKEQEDEGGAGEGPPATSSRHDDSSSGKA